MSHSLHTFQIRVKDSLDGKEEGIGFDTGKATEIDVPSSAAIKLRLAIARRSKPSCLEIENLVVLPTMCSEMTPFLVSPPCHGSGVGVSILLTSKNGILGSWARQRFLL